LITPYTNRRIEYLAGDEKPHLITHTKDVFIPVSRQGQRVEKGVGMPHWKRKHSFAYLCDTQGKADALGINGDIPRPWGMRKMIEIGKEELVEGKKEQWNEVVRMLSLKRKDLVVQTADGSVDGRRIAGHSQNMLVEGSTRSPIAGHSHSCIHGRRRYGSWWFRQSLQTPCRQRMGTLKP
jgi:hypothetical protein